MSVIVSRVESENSKLDYKGALRMRSPIKLGGIGLLVIGLSVLTTTSQAAKNTSSDEQVAILMGWYHTYFNDGKYKQAEHIAELAHELAPEDPQIAVALKLARRQQPTTAIASPKMEMDMERMLLKLDRVERQLRQMESQQRRQRTRIQIAKEPPGSPDASE
jgi:hypothetical protein